MLKRQVFILLGRTRNYFFNSHLKINSAISLLAFMPLFAVAFNSGSVTSGSVQNGVETELNALCDGQRYTLTTKANVVSQALEGTPCALGENDIVEPGKDTKLNGGSTNINVIKAVPVTINDNGSLKLGKSAYKNVNDILNQLNVKVYPEDVVTSELIISDFTENGLGQKITIKRSPAVVFEADGAIAQIRTNKGTVSEVLAERGITLGPKDEVTPAPNTNIITGTKITVVRVSESDVVEDEVIPFGVVNAPDNNMYQGQSRLESEGLNGMKKKTSRVVYRNGVLASKTILSETILKAPKNKVVFSGTKPYGAGDLWPIIVEAGAKYGVDPGAMYRVMMCESGGRVNAVNRGGYKGLFQWDGSFHKWTAIAGVPDDYFNPRSQIFATAARVHATGGWRAWSCKP